VVRSLYPSSLSAGWSHLRQGGSRSSQPMSSMHSSHQLVKEQAQAPVAVWVMPALQVGGGRGWGVGGRFKQSCKALARHA
jgi:hypothetical protein